MDRPVRVVDFPSSTSVLVWRFAGALSVAATPQQKAVRAVRLDFTFLSTNFTLSNLLTLQTKLTSR